MLCLARDDRMMLSPPSYGTSRSSSGSGGSSQSFPFRSLGGFASSFHHLLESPARFDFVPHTHGPQAGDPARVVVDHLAHAAGGAGEAEQVGDGEVVEDCDEDFWLYEGCG